MNILKEFKEFISRGNVFDMAVGVIMGGAFGKIVTALTNSVILPLIAIIAGKANVSALAVTIAGAQVPYGAFLQAVIDFLFTAIGVFILVKVINGINKKFESKKVQEPESEPEEEKPSNEEVLLSEIRDLLKNK